MPKDTVKICHFSDLHLVPEQPVPFFSLLNKRALGYANLRFNRGRTHKIENLRFLIREVVKEQADWVVVTGDFTSLALEFEFQTIHQIFEQAGLSPGNTLILPGNHDRYTITADHHAAFERGLKAWMPANFSKPENYPIVIDADPVLLIGLDTAVWRNPVRAAGAVSQSQLSRLKNAFRSENRRDRWPVIAMHHPPFHRGHRHFLHYRTGLSGYRRVIDAIATPATVLHGHLHILSRTMLKKVDIIGVSSASNDSGNPTTQFAYHSYIFNRDGIKEARVNRCWPDGAGGFRIEQSPLPEATF